MTLEEKMELVAKIKADYNSDVNTEISLSDEEELTDDEILKINDTISRQWKSKVLQWIRNLNTIDARPSDIKIVAEIIHQNFQQNKVIKDRKLWLPSENQNVFKIENANIVNILKLNWLR